MFTFDSRKRWPCLLAWLMGYLWACPAQSQTIAPSAYGWIDLDRGTRFYATWQDLCGGTKFPPHSTFAVECYSPDAQPITGFLGTVCPPGSLPDGHPRYTADSFGLPTAEFGVGESGRVVVGVGSQQCAVAPSTSAAIAIAGPRESRPSKAGGQTFLPLTLRVVRQGQGAPGVRLDVHGEVDFASGGHEQGHLSKRPLPKINGGSSFPLQLTTNAQGEVALRFETPEVAGVYRVVASCSVCANKAVHEIQVKVPDLVSIPTDVRQPAKHVLVGNTSFPGTNHPSNHWLTPRALDTLVNVVQILSQTGWGAVGINDAALPWGGLFDILGQWNPSHHGHRAATEVDISFSQPRSLSALQKKDAYTEICRASLAGLNLKTLWHKDDGYLPHFHLYLDPAGGVGASNPTCCARVRRRVDKLDREGRPVADGAGRPGQELITKCEDSASR